jgi:hypothetical protein
MICRAGLMTFVAALLLHGCGSENKVSSEDANLKRCQAACTNLCLDPYCSPCSVDDCENTCLGFTAGLEPVCAQCVATNISYGDGYRDGGKICVATFKSTASAECAPACIAGGDAGAGS